jgi:hypothetical protein
MDGEDDTPQEGELNNNHPSPAAAPSRRALWPWITALCVLVPLGCAGIIYWSLSSTAEAQWTAVQARLAATHHTLDFMALVPPPVPDDQNFYAIPALKNIALVIDNDETNGEPAERRKRLGALKIDRISSSFDLPRRGECADYGIEWEAARWADFFRGAEPLPMPPRSPVPGRDVLHGLESQQTLIDGLNAGNKRPYSQITPPWKDRKHARFEGELMLPHLTPVQDSLNVLMTHAEAAASSGNATQAVEDIHTMLRLSEGFGHEPTLLNTLMAITGLSLTERPLWSVLKQRSANEVMLARLDHGLEQVNVQAMVVTGMRGELVVCSQTCDTIANDPRLLMPFPIQPDASTVGEKTSSAMYYAQLQLNPHAVALGNKAAFVDLVLTHLLEPLEARGLTGFRETTEKFVTYEEMTRLAPGVFGLFSWQSLPGIRGVLNQALFTAIRMDQARVAIALERFFIRHGAYPEDPDVLVPEFLPALPADPMDGHPMRYKRAGDRYRLWSLGPNGRDDGGEVKPGPRDDPAEPRLRAPDYPGDWVWSYERLVPERLETPPVPPTPKKKRKSKGGG